PQVQAYRLIEAAQEQITAIQQAGLATQAMENRGELHGDIAAADYQHAAWLLRKMEHLVGVGGMFDTRDVRALRPAAHGNQDVLGAVAYAGHVDMVGIDQPCVPFEQLHATVHQQVAVDAIETLDFTILVADQRRPVETRLLDLPAETRRQAEVFVQVRAVHHELFRHTANIDTGAAQVAAFGYRHARAKTGSKARCAHAAGTGTDDKQVKIKGHGNSLPNAIGIRPGAYLFLTGGAGLHGRHDRHQLPCSAHTRTLRALFLPFGRISMLFTLRMSMMGIHFLIAGTLGLILGLCRPFNPDNSRLCARLYSWPALRLLNIKVDTATEGLRDHQRSCVIVANHQSNYDLYVLGKVVPKRTVSIGKKSLKWIPFFGQLYWLAGNVLIDRGNARQAKQAMLTTTDTLKHKDTSIWVFAEGRS